MALHLHRAALNVIEDEWSEVGVVLDEVALRQPARWEEQLLKICDRDLTLAD